MTREPDTWGGPAPKGFVGAGATGLKSVNEQDDCHHRERCRVLSAESAYDK